MSLNSRDMSLTSEQINGSCACGGRRCRTCEFCVDWIYDKNIRHWKRRSGHTCQRAHVDPDLNDDLEAGARKAKCICTCV